MSIKNRLADDMKQAMRAKDSARLSALRMLLAAIKQKEIDERAELDDVGVIATIERLLKQRKDSATQYAAAGREDLAANERFEIEVLSAYMPAPFSDAEIDALLDEALRETGASSGRDMGKVVAWLKPRLAGRADMAAVSARIKTRLG